jgi:DNA-binding HxlR family transcriptional regulator
MNNTTEHIGCIAAAAEILGTKWTALLLRDLSNGPKRFCDLERSNPGLNPRTLTSRLDELQSHAIIRTIDTEGTCYKAYQLTDKGHDLVPILKSMASWGERYPNA